MSRELPFGTDLLRTARLHQRLSRRVAQGRAGAAGRRAAGAALPILGPVPVVIVASPSPSPRPTAASAAVRRWRIGSVLLWLVLACAAKDWDQLTTRINEAMARVHQQFQAWRHLLSRVKAPMNM